jgi:hypothetical protein
MPGRRRAQIAFSDSAAKQLENLTDEHQIHALDRALVAISVDPEIGEPIPGTPPTPNSASTQTRSNESASCTSSPHCALWWSSRTSRLELAV